MSVVTRYPCAVQGGWLQGAQECKFTPKWMLKCDSAWATVTATCQTQLGTDCYMDYQVAGDSRGKFIFPHGKETTVRVNLYCSDLNQEHEVWVWAGWGEMGWQFQGTITVYVETPSPPPSGGAGGSGSVSFDPVLAGLIGAGAGLGAFALAYWYNVPKFKERKRG
ncbi:MAG: hypothetical protein ACP5MH_07265 [Thermoproteus sp.]